MVLATSNSDIAGIKVGDIYMLKFLRYDGECVLKNIARGATNKFIVICFQVCYFAVHVSEQEASRNLGCFITFDAIEGNFS